MSTHETSKRDTMPTPFTPAIQYQDVSSDQAIIFRQAAELLDKDMHLTQAIFAAGGTRQHVNQFSQSQCGGAPIDPWCNRNERTLDDIIAALEIVACEVEQSEK